MKLLLPFVLLAGGCATVGKDVPGIRNFATVDPAPGAIYRGAQPSRAGVATLEQMGVRTVLDLRDDPEPWERSAVESAGMTYVNIPTNAGRTEPQKVAAVLEALGDVERPVFIHCHRGRDRTGLAVAVYRLTEQSPAWPPARVLKELRDHGHQWLAFPGIERYIKAFDPPAVTAADAAS